MEDNQNDIDNYSKDILFTFLFYYLNIIYILKSIFRIFKSKKKTMKILTHLKMKVVLIRVVNTLTLKLIKAKMSQVKIIICQVKKLKIMKESYKI